MLAEPIFQFTEELSSSSTSSATSNATNSRIIPPLRTSLKRPSKLELKINLNEQQTESMTPLTQNALSLHLTSTDAARPLNTANTTHSHDKNNNFLNKKQNTNR